MSKGIVLSLFDVTGNMVKPWSAVGYQWRCYGHSPSLKDSREDKP